MATSTERDPRFDRVTPAEFHTAYPMSDMLDTDAPGALCKPEAFLKLLAGQDCPAGAEVVDGLYVLMARLIFNSVDVLEDVDELIDHLVMAKDDIDALIKWLEEL